MPKVATWILIVILSLLLVSCPSFVRAEGDVQAYSIELGLAMEDGSILTPRLLVAEGVQAYLILDSESGVEAGYRVGLMIDSAGMVGGRPTAEISIDVSKIAVQAQSSPVRSVFRVFLDEKATMTFESDVDVEFFVEAVVQSAGTVSINDLLAVSGCTDKSFDSADEPVSTTSSNCCSRRCATGTLTMRCCGALQCCA